MSFTWNCGKQEGIHFESVEVDGQTGQFILDYDLNPARDQNRDTYSLLRCDEEDITNLQLSFAVEHPELYKKMTDPLVNTHYWRPASEEGFRTWVEICRSLSDYGAVRFHKLINVHPGDYTLGDRDRFYNMLGRTAIEVVGLEQMVEKLYPGKACKSR